MTDINGTNGFKLLGENSGDKSGNSVSFAGDVISDEIQDFIIVEGKPKNKTKKNKKHTMAHLQDPSRSGKKVFTTRKEKRVKLTV